MKIRLALPLLITGLLLSACTTPVDNGVTAADITVEFQNPDKFQDARDSFGGSTDQSALDTLRAAVKDSARPHLKAGQKLQVTFTDIDLAGEFEPQAGPSAGHVRFIKAIYTPRLTLTFELTDAAGAMLRQGQRTLTDMNFQANSLRIGSDQPFFYDKVLVQDWVHAEFR
ncbi:MAG: DUF3016 domain-containing protein [Lacunisphaera sp.]|nr:DUF3016 domain-containing protein [Lacunisphaera sp.]